VRVLVANQTMTQRGVTLISGVRTPVVFALDENVTGTALTRLAFSIQTTGTGPIPVIFKDVPIQGTR
jgi:hypothetical protein